MTVEQVQVDAHVVRLRLGRAAIRLPEPLDTLARALGIHTDVAVTWQRHSAGDWATYAADVSRRDARHSNSSNT